MAARFVGSCESPSSACLRLPETLFTTTVLRSSPVRSPLLLVTTAKIWAEQGISKEKVPKKRLFVEPRLGYQTPLSTVVLKFTVSITCVDGVYGEMHNTAMKGEAAGVEGGCKHGQGS